MMKMLPGDVTKTVAFLHGGNCDSSRSIIAVVTALGSIFVGGFLSNLVTYVLVTKVVC